MNIAQSVILGVVEGLTEFLPVSSTGHLTIAEGVLGLKVDDKAVTAFTAVIQFGAIVAVLIYFRSDIIRLLTALGRGLVNPEARKDPDWHFVLCVLAGSVPIGIVGLATKSLVEGPLRSLWVVGAALIAWSGVMVFAERNARQDRGESETTLRDALTIGVVQCAALVPGVSRSGATISAGLLRGLDRVAATRLSFFLSIPALTAAGLVELPSATGKGVGVTPTIVGTVVSFVVAYATIAWLLRFVAGHSIAKFVPYRVAMGALVLFSMTVIAVTN
ncbi:MAG: undecaprenyl-diphosphate phosphatase [Frankia sp.]